MIFVYEDTALPVSVAKHINGQDGIALLLPDGTDQAPTSFGEAEDFLGEELLCIDPLTLVAYTARLHALAVQHAAAAGFHEADVTTATEYGTDVQDALL